MCVCRQKALRAQLDALRERRASLRLEGDGEDASWRLGIDEESEREAWLAQLELDSIHVSERTRAWHASRCNLPSRRWYGRSTFVACNCKCGSH